MTCKGRRSVKGSAGSLAVLALLLLSGGECRALGASEVAAAVQKKYTALRSLSARFSQESRLATLGRTRHKEGKIYFSRGGKMRWEYEGPEPQLIVTDGRTLWYYRPEQKQVVVQELGLAFTTQTPLLFLFGEGDLAEEFEWRREDLDAGPSGSYLLEMKPRRESPDLVGLAVEVRARDFSIASTTLEDAFGNITRLRFSDEKENPGLPAGLFTFEVPEGTEVVKP